MNASTNDKTQKNTNDMTTSRRSGNTKNISIMVIWIYLNMYVHNMGESLHSKWRQSSRQTLKRKRAFNANCFFGVPDGTY